jgi:hypothetical protein
VLITATPRPCFLVFFITITTLQHGRLSGLTTNATSKEIRTDLQRNLFPEGGE